VGRPKGSKNRTSISVTPVNSRYDPLNTTTIQDQDKDKLIQNIQDIIKLDDREVRQQFNSLESSILNGSSNTNHHNSKSLTTGTPKVKKQEDIVVKRKVGRPKGSTKKLSSAANPKLSPLLAKRRTQLLVITSINEVDTDVVNSVVNNLGVFRITCDFTSDVTHVVTGDNRRTLKVLQGIANGAYILKVEWIMRSLEEGKWLAEEPFEAIDWFPGARLSRLAIENKTERLLAGYALHIIGQTNPPKTVLEELIMAFGGKVCKTSMSKSDFCIASKFTTLPKIPDGITVVSEDWLMDVFSRYEILDTHSYLLTPLHDTNNNLNTSVTMVIETPTQAIINARHTQLPETQEQYKIEQHSQSQDSSAVL